MIKTQILEHFSQWNIFSQNSDTSELFKSKMGYAESKHFLKNFRAGPIKLGIFKIVWFSFSKNLKLDLKLHKNFLQLKNSMKPHL